jgi:CheY-like chemotaxis protein
MAVNFTKLSIQVVEDNKAMRDLIVSILDGLGVGRIYTSDNGETAFHVFRNNNPDIVIVDWEMPKRNGLELTDEIRRNSLSPNRMVPVIMLTGYSAPKRVAIARDSGATEFLAKPFTAESLINRIAYVINKPRDFIELPEFFGPDRRRKKMENYNGPFRRKSDRVSVGWDNSSNV